MGFLAKKISTFLLKVCFKKTSLGNRWISEYQQDAGGFEKGLSQVLCFPAKQKHLRDPCIIQYHSPQKRPEFQPSDVSPIM